MGIEPQRREDRGEETLLVDRLPDDVDAIGIGRADDDPAPQPASCHHQAPGIGIVVAAAGDIEPRGAAELPHRDHERGIEEAALLEIADEMEEDAIELRHEHLVDLVLEDMVVPVHAVGDHHERGAVLDEMPRHEGVLREAPRPVAFPITRGKPLDIEELGAGGQAPHPLEGGVLAAGNRAVPLALEARREKPPQRLARLTVVPADRIGGRVDELRVVAPQAHRGVLHAEPSGPVARLEALELVPPGDRIEEDEVRDRRIELPDRV